MPNNEALAVIRSLRRFRDDIDEIVNALVDKRTISIDERDRLQALTSPANRSMHKPRRGAA